MGYPNLIEMITRCESLYDEVSQLLPSPASVGPVFLREDERLFIHMISRFNEKVIENAAGEEGAPILAERMEKNRNSHLEMSLSCSNSSGTASISSQEQLNNSLIELVTENEEQQKSKPSVVASGDGADDDCSSD